MYTVTWEEDLLKDNFEIVFNEDIFFPATTKRVELDKFKTDIVIYGGMDPWESAFNSKYQMILAGDKRELLVYLTILLFI